MLVKADEPREKKQPKKNFTVRVISNVKAYVTYTFYTVVLYINDIYIYTQYVTIF